MVDDVDGIAKGLTKAQEWALHKIAEGRSASPAEFGQAMMERPGATKGRTTHYKAQGYGRMGGAMMARLRGKRLVILRSRSHGEWHPTKADLSGLGLAVLEQIKEANDDK